MSLQIQWDNQSPNCDYTSTFKDKVLRHDHEIQFVLIGDHVVQDGGVASPKRDENEGTERTSPERTLILVEEACCGTRSVSGNRILSLRFDIDLPPGPGRTGQSRLFVLCPTK